MRARGSGGEGMARRSTRHAATSNLTTMPLPGPAPPTRRPVSTPRPSSPPTVCYVKPYHHAFFHSPTPYPSLTDQCVSRLPHLGQVGRQVAGGHLHQRQPALAGHRLWECVLRGRWCMCINGCGYGACWQVTRGPSPPGAASARWSPPGERVLRGRWCMGFNGCGYGVCWHEGVTPTS